MISFKNLFCALLVATALSACGGSQAPNQTIVDGASPSVASIEQSDMPVADASRQAATLHIGALPSAVAAPQLRVVHFDLDPIYSDSDDAAQVTSNIAQMSARVRALYRPGMDLVIYLSAFSNVTATQNSYDQMFFPSTHLAERGGKLQFNDTEMPKGALFARAARAIKRAVPGVKVYAWMPTLNYRVSPNSTLYADSQTSYIQSDLPSEQNDTSQYKRLSPFVGVVWDIVAQTYYDLGTSAGKYIDGIVFHDDGIITDHEDASPSAHAFLKSYDWSALVPGDARGWNQLDSMGRAVRKARYLDQFSLYMVQQTEAAIADSFGATKRLGTARHVYSSAFTNPNSVEWLAQEPTSLLKDYDYVLIEAYPYMEARNNPKNTQAGANYCELKFVQGCSSLNVTPFYDALYAAVAKQPKAIQKVVFVMQTVDWNTATGTVTDLTSDMLGNQMRALFQKGAIHFGWYPDRYFSADAHPEISGDFNNMLVLRR